MYFVENCRAPAASSTRSDATAKEVHVNYDVSDVLVEARGAPKTGSGLYGLVLVAQRRVVESSIFLVGVHEGGSAKYTTPTQL